jgi:uncharacterized RDD family membrane protein YckC
MIKSLATAVEKIKKLSPERQAYAAHVLDQIAADDNTQFQVPDDHRAGALEGLEQMKRGERAPSDAVEALLRRPWADEIRTYLLPRSPQGAESVRSAIADTLDLLVRFSRAGRETDIAGVRVIPVVRYRSSTTRCSLVRSWSCTSAHLQRHPHAAGGPLDACGHRPRDDGSKLPLRPAAVPLGTPAALQRLHTRADCGPWRSAQALVGFMTDVSGSLSAAVSARAPQDAGFWKRALALVIDACMVGTTVSLSFLLLALLIPSLGNMITLNTPFGVGTVERTIETKSIETGTAGAKLTDTKTIVEESVLDRWTYRYRIEETTSASKGARYTTTVRTSMRQQIDPVTGEDIATVSVDDIALVVLMLYWILADASRYQGSLGKRVLGLKVADKRGGRLTLAAAAGRNLLKILSAILLLVGFMMAGWTRRKQALHDKLTDSYVLAEQ